jgi:hypothetical protein
MSSLLPANPPNLPTFDQVLAALSVITDEQRSLFFCPMPPPESTGPHDCRIGGSCGLDFNHETRRSRWTVARFRCLQEAKKQAQQAQQDAAIASLRPLIKSALAEQALEPNLTELLRQSIAGVRR